jgi:hypothetical protein
MIQAALDGAAYRCRFDAWLADTRWWNDQSYFRA